MAVLIIDALIVFADTLTTTYAGNTAQSTADHLVLFGPYRWIFWIGEVVVGLVLPVLIVALPATNNRVGWLGFAGVCVVVGMLGARLTLVLPPQITPVFPESLGAYNHLRYMLRLFPEHQRHRGVARGVCPGALDGHLGRKIPAPRNSIAHACTGRRCIVMTVSFEETVSC